MATGDDNHKYKVVIPDWYGPPSLLVASVDERLTSWVRFEGSPCPIDW